MNIKTKKTTYLCFGFFLLLGFFISARNVEAVQCRCGDAPYLGFIGTYTPVGNDVDVPCENVCVYQCSQRSGADSYFYYGSLNQWLSISNPAATPSATCPSAAAPTAGNISLNYVPMEEIPGQPTAPATDFYTYISYIYKFGIGAVGIAALFMIIVGGFMYITSAGNNARMESAKGVITDALIGLVMALSAWLLLYTINPDLVRLRPISVIQTAAPAQPTPLGAITPLGSPSPGDPTRTVTAVCSGATTDYSTCVGTTCSVGRCNNLSSYESLIQVASTNTNLDPREVKAIICAESSGNPNSTSPSIPPSCGLMQVQAQSGYNCTNDPRGNLLTDTTLNITEGTRILRQKKNALGGRDYSSVGITSEQLSYATYNCCSNGEIPSDPSRDCGPTVPKWACNLNPGTGNERTGNMCAVRNYVCSMVDACKALY